MTKQEQFLKMVQTAIIIMHLKGRGSGDNIVYSIINMDDAIYASERIPENMTASEAAKEFMLFILKHDDHLREGWEHNPNNWYSRAKKDS